MVLYDIGIYNETCFFPIDVDHWLLVRFIDEMTSFFMKELADDAKLPLNSSGK